MVDAPTVSTPKAAAPPPPAVAPTAPAPKPKLAPAVTAQRWGFDPLRPVRYALSFVWGTVTGALDGMGAGARRGIFWGLVGGALFAIAGASGASGLAAVLFGYHEVSIIIPNLVAGLVGGFVAGAAIGAAWGMATGGVRGVGRTYRREKHADDLAVRQTSRASRGEAYVDYYDRYKHARRAADYNFDRLQQIDRRAEGEIRDYWTSRVSGEERGRGRNA